MAVTYDQIQTARQAGYSDSDIINHLAASDSQVKTAIDSGYAPGEIINYLAKNAGGVIPTASPTDYKAMRDKFIADQGTIGTRIKQGAKDAVTAAMPYVRPVVEGLGAGAGGLAGGTLGAAAGGISAVPGAIAGAGLGYAGAKSAMDLVDKSIGNAPMQSPRELLATTARDIGTGATMEMGGQVAGKVIGAAVPKVVNAYRSARSALSANTPALTQSGVSNAAGRILNESSGTSPLYESNAAAANQVAEDVPGFRASLGEARNDPGLIKLQRGMESQPGTAADLVAQKNAANRQALSGTLDTAFPTQATIEDTTAALQGQKSGIEANTSATDIAAQRTAQGLKPVDTQSAGRNVIDAIEKERIPAKQAVTDQYNALPNEAIPTSNTAQAIRDLQKDFRPGDEDVYPSRAISRVQEALRGAKPEKGAVQILDAQGNPIRSGADFDPTKSQVGFQDLHSLRKDIGRQIQDASTGMNPNRELAAKLQRIKSGIDTDIEAGMGANNDYTTARQAFSDYANKYRTGDVEAVLRRGNQATGRNVPDALIAKKMATPDGADSFINSVGQKSAATVMEGHFADDMLAKVGNPQTGELNPKALSSWVQKNGAVLDKYGLRSQFDSVNSAHQALDAAKTAEAAFNKTVAAKMLNADPQNAIAAAMGGAEGMSAKNTGAIMAKLVDQVKDNPAALDGLKNGWKDFIMSVVETTKKTIAGDNMISPASIQKMLAKYEPASRVLFKDSPQQLAALQNIQKGVEIQGRSAQGVGGGADTAEKLNAVGGLIPKITSALGSAIAGGGLGLAIHGIPGGTLGAVAGAGIKTAANVVSEHSSQLVNSLLARALYDPPLAKILMDGATKMAPKEFTRQITPYLQNYITAGSAAIKGANNATNQVTQ